MKCLGLAAVDFATDHSVVVTHMMAIRSGHSNFGGGGGAAPMMVDSSDSPSRIHGD
uniref:Uncharacterized protein n=1 Tax=Triticum urartu TaxID=4572 RepID=A0A8R7QIW2_TRIUA